MISTQCAFCFRKRSNRFACAWTSTSMPSRINSTAFTKGGCSLFLRRCGAVVVVDAFFSELLAETPEARRRVFCAIHAAVDDFLAQIVVTAVAEQLRHLHRLAKGVVVNFYVSL